MLSQRTVAAAIALLIGSTALVGCSSTSTPPLSAPESIGEWTTVTAWAADNGAKKAIDNAAKDRIPLDRDAKNLSAAFAGAASVVDTYQLDDLSAFLSMRMVASQAPAYFVASSQSDTDAIEAAAAPLEVQHFGLVECRVWHPSPLAAESLDNVFTECMRRNAGLTVWLGPVALLPKDVAGLVEVAWDKAGGTGEGPTAFASTNDDARTPIMVPATLGEKFFTKDTVANWAPSSERRAAYAAVDVANLSQMHQAAAAAESFSLGDASGGFDIFAYRASTPEPFVAEVDTDRLEILAPLREKVVAGKTTCLVHNSTVSAGGDRDELQPKIEWCFFTQRGLTVVMERPFGDAASNVDEMAAIVEEIVAAIE